MKQTEGKYGITPGTIFKIYESNSDKDGPCITKKYQVLELYPHIVLTERLGTRTRSRRCFRYWDILKAQGKIRERPRKDFED